MKKSGIPKGSPPLLLPLKVASTAVSFSREKINVILFQIFLIFLNKNSSNEGSITAQSDDEHRRADRKSSNDSKNTDLNEISQMNEEISSVSSKSTTRL